jgi:hypothetical protein
MSVSTETFTSCCGLAGRECQVSRWPAHRKECNTLREETLRGLLHRAFRGQDYVKWFLRALNMTRTEPCQLPGGAAWVDLNDLLTLSKPHAKTDGSYCLVFISHKSHTDAVGCHLRTPHLSTRIATDVTSVHTLLCQP